MGVGILFCSHAGGSSGLFGVECFSKLVFKSFVHGLSDDAVKVETLALVGLLHKDQHWLKA